MTTKEDNTICRAIEKREEPFPIDDELDLLPSENFMQDILTLQGILPVLFMLRTDWIKRIEPLKAEGLRFYIETKPSQVQDSTVQILRKMLERTVNAPINIYWGLGYIDFVPI